MSPRVRRQVHGVMALGLVSIGSVVSPAWAGPSIAADVVARPDRKNASALVVQGVALYKDHKYGAARDAFAQAYVLDPQPGTLLNLALSELKADEPVQAAHDFREYLRHTDEPQPKLDSVKTTYLPLAESQIARLDIYAPEGAAIAVDGQPQAATLLGDDGEPLADGRSLSMAVRSGEHEIRVSQGALVEVKRVAARGGEVMGVHFQRVADALLAEPPPRSEGPTASASSAPAQPMAKWIAVGALGSGALVAAGLGIGFSMAARNQASSSQALRSTVDPAGTGSACFGIASGACASLGDDVQAARRNSTLSTASYAAAGALGAASLATWMLWRPGSEPGPKSAFLVPTVTPRGAGLLVTRDW
jgi:hypothetical protein